MEPTAVISLNPKSRIHISLHTKDIFLKPGKNTENGYKSKYPFCKAGKKAERIDTLVWRSRTVRFFEKICTSYFET